MSAQMAVDPPKPPKFDLGEFISTAISATPVELHPYFESFRNLHTRKCVSKPCTYAYFRPDILCGFLLGCVCRLWHQLTLKLFEFLEDPLSKPYQVDTFERFVRDFETKMNQLRLVEMAVKVSKEIDSESFLLSC
jgi:26S proteasome regulatory subunit N9